MPRQGSPTRLRPAGYTLTIDPIGLKLAQKGHRKGVTMAWKDLLSGDAALAVALRASLS
jgi:hypothetical protein